MLVGIEVALAMVALAGAGLFLRSYLVRMVAQQTLILVIPGLLAGIAVALAAFRMFSGMLFGVGPADPVTIGGSAVFLVAVALLAGYLPARRAARIDPMIALRYQ